MLPINFTYLGLLIISIGGFVYLFKTLKGEVKPNKVTWFLWSLAPLIAFAAQLKQGVGIQAWLTFVVGFQPLLIFIASFINKKSYWKITRLDLFFGLLSILGLILWQITGIGNIAILFSIIADSFAAIPTVIKSYKFPESENYFAYFTSVLGSLIILLTINIWNFETAAFSFYIFIINIILSSLIYFKIGKKISKAKQ